MATRRTTTGRASGTRQRPPVQRYETDPDRIKLILDTLDGIYDVTDGRIADKFTDADELRALARRMRLPFVKVHVTRYGTAELTDADVNEYNAWRAAVGSKAGAR